MTGSLRYSGSLLCALLLGACSSARQTAVPPASPVVAVGPLERSFMQEEAHWAYAAVYDSSRIAPEFTGLIGAAGGDVDYLVFLGTWCSDSRREVPRFLKIMDQAGITADRIRLYGVDRAKESGDGMAGRYAISRVPTFILLRGGEELGRIVEHPVTTLEGDLLDILSRAALR